MLSINLFEAKIFFNKSLHYFIGTLINASIPFLLLPFLTQYLSPNEYGQIAMFTITLSIVYIFLGLNFHGAIGREFFDKNIKIKEYIFNCFLLVCISTALIFFIVLIVGDWLSNWLDIPLSWLYIIMGVAFFQFFFQIFLTLYQVQGKSKRYVFLQSLQAIGLLLLTLFLIYWCDFKAEGRVWAHMISIFCVVMYYLKKYHGHVFRWKINVLYMKRALQFGLPLIPHSLGGILVVAVDRFVINQQLGLYEVGIYAVGLQLGRVIGIITTSLHKVYTPLLYHTLEQKNTHDNRQIVLYTYGYFLVLVLIGGLFILCVPSVISVFLNDAYFTVANIIFWIVLGEIFQGMYYGVVGYLFFSRKTGVLAKITFFTGITSIISTYLLVLYYGIKGAAIAYAMSYLIIFLLTWYYAAIIHPMPWGIKR